ncbi:MAG: hypothetical protein QOF60_170 [Actinomycetota bacterium]|jgi:hypothetical protein|nr:hypothetical protein [Actinomycetota bacterium]
MPKLIALWTAADDSDGFNADYLATHVGLAQAMPSVSSTFFGTTAGPYARVADLTWSSADEMNAALGSPAGAALLGDAQRLQQAFGNRLDVLIVNED